MLGGGLLAPWFSLVFEPHSVSLRPLLGWEYLAIEIGNEAEYLSRSGPDWSEIPFLLVEIGVVIAIAYILLNMLRLVKPRTGKGSRWLFVLLAMTMLAFLYHAWTRMPVITTQFGFWLFIFGLMSSAICEWRNSVTAP